MNGLREIESGNGDAARGQDPVVGIKDLSQTGLTSLDQWIGAQCGNFGLYVKKKYPKNCIS